MRSRRRVASLRRSNVEEIMFSRISWRRKERWGDAAHRCRSLEPGTVLAVLDLESVATGRSSQLGGSRTPSAASTAAALFSLQLPLAAVLSGASWISSALHHRRPGIMIIIVLVRIATVIVVVMVVASSSPSSVHQSRSPWPLGSIRRIALCLPGISGVGNTGASQPGSHFSTGRPAHWQRYSACSDGHFDTSPRAEQKQRPSGKIRSEALEGSSGKLHVHFQKEWTGGDRAQV